MNLSPKPETGRPAGPLPRQPEKAGLPESQADIVQLLAPVRRAIGLERIARGALLGLAVGSAVGAAVLVAPHIYAFHFAVPVGLLAIAVGVMAGAAFAIWRWPGAPEAARAADFHFHLNDRLTTALELRSSDTPVALVQRRDVTSRIDGLPLAKSRGPWLRRRDGAMTALAAMAFAGALALGAPGQAHHNAAAAPAQTQRMRKAAATQLQQLTSKLHLGLTPAQRHSEALRKLDLALARLRRQLLQASTRRTALRAISTTQQQLRQLALGLHPVNGKAVARLNSSLARYLNKGQAGYPLGANTQASARSMLATAQALNRLAQSLAHLTPAQRAALALALAKAANATSDNTLRQGLHQAASSLANGDTQSATAALQQTAQALAQTPSAQAALSRLSAAGSQLNLLKNQVSGVAGGVPFGSPAGTPSGSQSNQPGASNTGSSGRGTGQRNGYSLGTRGRSGKGQGTGNRAGGQGRLGIRGRGRGSGRGTRTGRGIGRGQSGQPQGSATRSGSGQGTSGARGRGGRGQGGLSRSGRNATVYIPARQGKGQETIQNGPNGAPAPGSIVPYHQVIGQFTQSARQALDRATLPSSLRQYVRRYFGTLSQ